MLTIAWALFAQAATYMLPGFAVAGLLHAFVRSDRLLAPLRSRGTKPVFLATLIGIPLPLCSCSVVPTAIALHRKGASAGATSSFLISTPETSVTSILLTYGLLGPFFAVARPVAAFITAITAGLAANRMEAQALMNGPDAPAACCVPEADAPADAPTQVAERIRSGLRFAFVDLLEDVFGWVVFGVLVAAAIQTWIPQSTLLSWLGHPLLGMFIVIAIGVPLYVCAEASTPIAASLIAGGVSPGVALVFLLVGPATNIGSLGILRRELGTRIMVVYVGAIILVSALLGLLLDRTLHALPSSDVSAHVAHGYATTPLENVVGAAFLLLGLSVVFYAWWRARVRKAA